MPTLRTTLALSVNTYFQSALDLSTPEDNLTNRINQTMQTGTGVNQADRVWHDQRTLNAVTSETLDVSGSLTDPFGVTVAFVKIKGILINLTTVTSGAYLLVGGVGANAFFSFLNANTEKIKITAGGCLFLWAPVDGYAVTAGTADLLKVDNPTGIQTTYNIQLIGTSA